MKFSVCKLDDEFRKIIDIFLANGYPKRVILSNVKFTVSNFHYDKTFSSPKCPVYFKILWIRYNSQFFVDKISSFVVHYFNYTVVLYCLKSVSLPTIKIVCLPAHKA